METFGVILFFLGLICTLIVLIIMLGGIFKPLRYKRGSFWKEFLAESITFLVMFGVCIGLIFLGSYLAGW